MPTNNNSCSNYVKYVLAPKQANPCSCCYNQNPNQNIVINCDNNGGCAGGGTCGDCGGCLPEIDTTKHNENDVLTITQKEDGPGLCANWKPPVIGNDGRDGFTFVFRPSSMIFTTESGVPGDSVKSNFADAIENRVYVYGPMTDLGVTYGRFNFQADATDDQLSNNQFTITNLRYSAVGDNTQQMIEALTNHSAANQGRTNFGLKTAPDGQNNACILLNTETGPNQDVVMPYDGVLDAGVNLFENSDPFRISFTIKVKSNDNLITFETFVSTIHFVRPGLNGMDAVLSLNQRTYNYVGFGKAANPNFPQKGQMCISKVSDIDGTELPIGGDGPNGALIGNVVEVSFANDSVDTELNDNCIVQNGSRNLFKTDGSLIGSLITIRQSYRRKDNNDGNPGTDIYVYGEILDVENFANGTGETFSDDQFRLKIKLRQNITLNPPVFQVAAGSTYEQDKCIPYKTRVLVNLQEVGEDGDDGVDGADGTTIHFVNYEQLSTSLEEVQILPDGVQPVQTFKSLWETWAAWDQTTGAAAPINTGGTAKSYYDGLQTIFDTSDVANDRKNARIKQVKFLKRYWLTLDRLGNWSGVQGEQTLKLGDSLLIKFNPLWMFINAEEVVNDDNTLYDPDAMEDVDESLRSIGFSTSNPSPYQLSGSVIENHSFDPDTGVLTIQFDDGEIVTTGDLKAYVTFAVGTGPTEDGGNGGVVGHLYVAYSLDADPTNLSLDPWIELANITGDRNEVYTYIHPVTPGSSPGDVDAEGLTMGHLYVAYVKVADGDPRPQEDEAPADPSSTGDLVDGDPGGPWRDVGLVVGNKGDRTESYHYIHPVGAGFSPGDAGVGDDSHLTQGFLYVANVHVDHNALRPQAGQDGHPGPKPENQADLDNKKWICIGQVVGNDGSDGRGIDNIEIVDGNITITYDDGTDYGPVNIRGPAGNDGADGINACLPNTGMWASVENDPTESGQFKVFKAADGDKYLLAINEEDKNQGAFGNIIGSLETGDIITISNPDDCSFVSFKIEDDGEVDDGTAPSDHPWGAGPHLGIHYIGLKTETTAGSGFPDFSDGINIPSVDALHLTFFGGIENTDDFFSTENDEFQISFGGISLGGGGVSEDNYAQSLTINPTTGDVTIERGTSDSGPFITPALTANIPPNFGNVDVHGNVVIASQLNDTLNLNAGTNISLDADTAGKSITISAFANPRCTTDSKFVDAIFRSGNPVTATGWTPGFQELQLMPGSGASVGTFQYHFVQPDWTLSGTGIPLKHLKHCRSHAASHQLGVMGYVDNNGNHICNHLVRNATNTNYTEVSILINVNPDITSSSYEQFYSGDRIILRNNKDYGGGLRDDGIIGGEVVSFNSNNGELVITNIYTARPRTTSVTGYWWSTTLSAGDICVTKNIPNGVTIPGIESPNIGTGDYIITNDAGVVTNTSGNFFTDIEKKTRATGSVVPRYDSVIASASDDSGKPVTLSFTDNNGNPKGSEIQLLGKDNVNVLYKPSDTGEQIIEISATGGGGGDPTPCEQYWHNWHPYSNCCELTTFVNPPDPPVFPLFTSRFKFDLDPNIDINGQYFAISWFHPSGGALNVHKNSEECKIATVLGQQVPFYTTYFIREWKMFFYISSQQRYILTFRHFGDFQDPEWVVENRISGDNSILKLERQDEKPLCKAPADGSPQQRAPWYKYDIVRYTQEGGSSGVRQVLGTIEGVEQAVLVADGGPCFIDDDGCETIEVPNPGGISAGNQFNVWFDSLFTRNFSSREFTRYLQYNSPVSGDNYEEMVPETTNCKTITINPVPEIISGVSVNKYEIKIILEYNGQKYHVLTIVSRYNPDKKRPSLTDDPWSSTKGSQYDDLIIAIFNSIPSDQRFIKEFIPSIPGIHPFSSSHRVLMFAHNGDIWIEDDPEKRIRERDRILLRQFQMSIKVDGVSLVGDEELTAFGVTETITLPQIGCRLYRTIGDDSGDTGGGGGGTGDDDIGEEEELSLGGFYDPLAPNYSVNKFLLSLSNRSTLSIVGTQDNIIGDTGYEPFAATSALGSLGLSSAKDVVYHRFLAIQSSEYNTITLYGSDNLDNTSFNGNVSVAIYSNDVTLDAPGSLLTFGTTAFNTNMQNKYINIKLNDRIVLESNKEYWVAVDSSDDLYIARHVDYLPALSLVKKSDGSYASDNSWPDGSEIGFSSDSIIAGAFYFRVSLTEPSLISSNEVGRDIDRIRLPGTIECGRVSIIYGNTAYNVYAIGRLIPSNQEFWRGREGELWTVNYVYKLDEIAPGGYFYGFVETKEPCVSIPPPPIVKNDYVYFQSFRASFTGTDSEVTIGIRLGVDLPLGSNVKMAIYSNDVDSNGKPYPKDKLGLNERTSSYHAHKNTTLTITLSSDIYIQEGTIYWIGVFVQSTDTRNISLYGGNNDSLDTYFRAYSIQSEGSAKFKDTYLDTDNFVGDKVAQYWFSIEGTGIKCGGGGGGDTLNGGYKITQIESIAQSAQNRRKIKITQETEVNGVLESESKSSLYTNIYGKMGRSTLSASSSQQLKVLQVAEHLSNNIKQDGVPDKQLNGPFDQNTGSPVTNNVGATSVNLVALKPVVTRNSGEDLCLANIKFSLSVKCIGSVIDSTSFSLWGKISTSGNNIMVNHDGDDVIHNHEGVLLLSKTNISTLDDQTGKRTKYVFDVNFDTLIKCANGDNLSVDLVVFSTAAPNLFEFKVCQGNANDQWSNGYGSQPTFRMINITNSSSGTNTDDTLDLFVNLPVNA